MGVQASGFDVRNLPRGLAVIRSEECKGCALCVDVCPPGALQLSDRINPLGHRTVELTKPELCTGCALCYVECPGSVIAVYRRSKSAIGTRTSA